MDKFARNLLSKTKVLFSCTVAGHPEEEDKSSEEEDDLNMKEKLADCQQQLAIAEEKLSEATEKIHGKIYNEINI